MKKGSVAAISLQPRDSRPATATSCKQCPPLVKTFLKAGPDIKIKGQHVKHGSHAGHTLDDISDRLEFEQGAPARLEQR